MKNLVLIFQNHSVHFHISMSQLFRNFFCMTNDYFALFVSDYMLYKRTASRLCTVNYCPLDTVHSYYVGMAPRWRHRGNPHRTYVWNLRNNDFWAIIYLNNLCTLHILELIGFSVNTFALWERYLCFHIHIILKS